MISNSFGPIRPTCLFRSISGGNWVTSLAVATTKTGAVFSCIQLKNYHAIDEVIALLAAGSTQQKVRDLFQYYGVVEFIIIIIIFD